MPHTNCPVFTRRDEVAVRENIQGIDEGSVTGQGVHEVAFQRVDEDLAAVGTGGEAEVGYEDNPADDVGVVLEGADTLVADPVLNGLVRRT
jgi:hypothetical protein